jgi:hypothetical protein
VFNLLGGDDLWIGIYQVGTGPFAWVTSEPVIFTVWAPSMPDDKSDALGRIAPDGWHDTNAREKYLGLCERDP